MTARRLPYLFALALAVLACIGCAGRTAGPRGGFLHEHAELTARRPAGPGHPGSPAVIHACTIVPDRPFIELVLSFNADVPPGTGLAAEVHVSSPTAKLWLESLCALHYGFVVRPWHRNLGKMLRKEPKWFLRDWAGIQDPGRRSETFIACHLLQAVEGWTDLGLGDFELRYLRDTRQREVDFCIVRDGRPWCLIEVKHGDGSLSPHLAYFQRLTGAPHALQVSMSAPYVDADCFAQEAPTVVPARSLLSQLL